MKATNRITIQLNNNFRFRLASELFSHAALCILLLVAVYLFGNMNEIWGEAWSIWSIVYIAKTGIESIACIFAIFYILVALYYQKPKIKRHDISLSKKYSNIAIAYLCCDDIEYKALESIIASGSHYSIPVIVHDDSTSKKYRSIVDNAVIALQKRYSLPIRIIRRKHRVGGKPGAVNNILTNLPLDIEFILLCDSDSFLPNNNFYEKALSYFQDPRVALVQFRNIGQLYSEDSSQYKVLSGSIDFYDAFVNFMERFGWTPFLGHNALLRVSVLKKTEGFTPGQLADDIDYSVKLRLKGYTIRYARDIVAGERHPSSYASLRLRTQKWAYGCTQILVRWGWAIMKSKRLSFSEKMSFFLTVGYYHFQLLLLVYLLIFYIILPFHDPEMGGTLSLMFSAGLILFFTFMPSITYFIRNNKLPLWPKTAICWGITYGSQDFVMLIAVLNCLLRGHLGWVPTNGASQQIKTSSFHSEVIFGILIMVVSATQHPTLLLLPTTILFVSKFLFAPFLGKWLDNHVTHIHQKKIVSIKI